MRLTLALLKKKHVIPGNKWLGKHRLPHKINPWNIEAVERRLAVEEKNMFYLRHPYLTLGQEKDHEKVLEKHKEWLNKMKLFQAARRVNPSVRIEDRLAHLNFGNVWER